MYALPTVVQVLNARATVAEDVKVTGTVTAFPLMCSVFTIAVLAFRLDASISPRAVMLRNSALPLR